MVPAAQESNICILSPILPLKDSYTVYIPQYLEANLMTRKRDVSSPLSSQLRCGFMFCPYTGSHTILISITFNCSPVNESRDATGICFHSSFSLTFPQRENPGFLSAERRNSCFSPKSLWPTSKNHYWQIRRDSSPLWLHPNPTFVSI